MRRAIPTQPTTKETQRTVPPSGRRGLILRQGVTVALVAAAYVVTAKLGLELASVHPSATPVWAPTGIALASVLLLGYRAWPITFAAAFYVNITTAGNLWTALGIAAGNTGEALIGAYLINRYAHGRDAFYSSRTTLTFMLLGAGVAPMVSATAGVTSLALGGYASWHAYPAIWMTWWLGDMAGAVIVAPLLILWSRPARWELSGREIGERGLFLAILAADVWVVFGGVFPFVYLTVPLTMWAAFRLSLRETSTVIVLLAGIAAVATIRGTGPFHIVGPNASLLYLVAFMGILSLAGLPVASVVAERAGVSRALADRMRTEQAAHAAAERTAHRLAQLYAVSEALSPMMTSGEVADDNIGEGSRILGASAAAVYRLSEDGAALELLRTRGYPDDMVERWRHLPTSRGSLVVEAARTGQPHYVPSRDAMLSQYPGADGTALPHAGARAVAPLLVGPRTTGALVFVFDGPKEFNEEERGLIAALAHQCAQALERSRLYERERKVAEMLQGAFLPAGLPQVPGIRVRAAYVPATATPSVGGDWYDVFRLPDGRIALSVGDVVGHGVQAAAVMGQVRQSIRAAALDDAEPARVLARADRVLTLTYEFEAMATAIFARFDPIALTLEYATAGHPSPVVAHADGSVRILPGGGLPLGYAGDRVFPSRTVQLAPSSLLVMYTDGVTELTRNPAAGRERLLAAVAHAHETGAEDPARSILEQILGGASAPDDMAIVSVAVDAAAVAELDLTLPAQPSSVRLVRQAVRKLATGLALDEDRSFTLSVAVGEAVNNVIEHAYGVAPGKVYVRARRDGASLRVEVEDRGQWRPAGPRGTGGRGLALIGGLTEHLELIARPTGTIIRFTVPLERPLEHPQADGPGTPRPAVSRSPQPRAEAATAPPARPPDAARDGRFEVRPRDGVAVVDAAGDIDLDNLGRFMAALDRAAAQGERAVILNLEAATYIDSRGVHALFQAGQRFKTRRRDLLLVIPEASPLRTILAVTKLGSMLEVFHTLDEALASPFGGNPAG